MDTAIADATSNAAARTQYLRLLDAIGVAEADVGGRVTITGSDPVVPSRYRTGAAAAAALAAMGAAVAAIWRMRSGRGQDVTVDIPRAVVPGLKTSALVWQNGYPIENHPRMPAAAGERRNFFASGDGRRHYILRATAYPDLLFRLSELLKCGLGADSVAAACLAWKKGEELEDAIAGAKAVGAMARTAEEWAVHPQGKWLAARPPAEVERIGQSPAEPFQPGARPLSGIRVLDIAHVLAGPVTARMLAEQGADVLHVSVPFQADRLAHSLDTGIGKRQATIDLERPDHVELLRQLVRECDVFVQSWRPGVLERFGFGPEDVAKLRPGIVYASVSCYGSGGPWGHRGGYEPIGQTLAGLAIAEGTPENPKLAPTGTLNDYLTPSLAAAGTVGALVQRARRGGSYHVKASLTRSSMYVLETGPLSPEERARMPAAVPEPLPEHLIDLDTPAFGSLRLAAPITQYSETRAYWDKPPAMPSSGLAQWLPR